MLIQTGPSSAFVKTASLQDNHKHPPGHDHGGHGGALIPMDAVHVAHDIAMIGMNLPGLHHHGGHSAQVGMDHSAHAGHAGHAGHGASSNQAGPFDAFSNGGRLNQGLTVLSAAAAAGATYHGIKLLQDGEIGHGANHLLQGAGMGTMALAMATGSHGLHQASSVLMGAHGAVEAGLGVRDFISAKTTRDKAQALTTTVHGACLAAAQMTNNALFTIPLYLGMGAATAASIIIEQSR